MTTNPGNNPGNSSGNSASIVVVGSGPSGMAAAKALLQQGLEVTMLDAGITMPAAARQLRDELAGTAPDAWDRSALAARNRASLKERGAVPLKTHFGSDYPYDFNANVRAAGASILASHARGGLSTVWGASILPLSERDTRGWPVSAAELAPHYTAVLEWLPHAQVADELAGTYPLHSPVASELSPSRQARKLLADLRAGAPTLAAAGISFGQARLALSNCSYCRQCLHGCPYDFIYSTNATLAELRGHPGFTYRGNVHISGLEEHADHVLLHAAADGATTTFRADRVFLGTGVLNTALLLMPLLDKRELLIRDSAYYLVPFLSYARMPDVANEALHTLAQVFMEVDVPAVSEHNVHLQWYSYNDFYQPEIEKSLGPLRGLVPDMVMRQVVERMWTIQGFLHSEDSPSVRLTLDSAGTRASLAEVPNERAARLFKAALGKLSGLSHVLRGRPLPVAGRNGTAGNSFHSGASLPMARAPGPLESDLAGRPAGLQRVHVVDASVLPGIASSTITLSVMANAHRIASDYRHYA